MLEKIEHLKSGEKEYPFAFNLNVMAEIQDEYGTVQAWSDKISSENGEASFKDLIYTCALFINEGIDIENENAEIKRPFITQKQAGRILTSLGKGEFTDKLMKIVSESNPKNV